MDVHATPDANQNTPQPVRTHQDVLDVIAEVERQLGRLREAESRHLQEADELRTRLAAELEGRMRQLAEREAALHAGEAMLMAREAQLRSLAESLRDEKASAAMAVAESENRAAALAARESAIESQRQALEQERELCNAERHGLEALREECAQRDQMMGGECAALRAAADAAKAELERMRERCADMECSLSARDTVFERKSVEVDALQAELGSLRDALSAAEGRAAKASDENERLRLEFEQAVRSAESTMASSRIELDAARAEWSGRLAEADATIASLRGELDAKRRELSTLAASARQCGEAIDSERKQFDQALEEKRSALAEVGVFLKRRKERIARARRLQKERVRREQSRIRAATEAANVRVVEEGRMVKKEREELRQVQEMLAISEQTLLRKASRHRAAVTVSVCAVAMAMLAIASWLAAGAAFPTPSVASVDLVAKGGEGQTDSPEIDTVFQAVYREALHDETFRSVVAKRLQERGVAALGSPSEVAAWMESIRIDSDGPGSIRLIAEASDPDTAIIALDTVATSLVNEAPKLSKGRSVPRVLLTGNSNQPGRMTFSTLVPQSGPGDRVLAAGVIFSGVVTVCGIAGLFVFGRLSKAKRSFEESEPA